MASGGARAAVDVGEGARRLHFRPRFCGSAKLQSCCGTGFVATLTQRQAREQCCTQTETCGEVCRTRKQCNNTSAIYRNTRCAHSTCRTVMSCTHHESNAATAWVVPVAPHLQAATRHASARAYAPPEATQLGTQCGGRRSFRAEWEAVRVRTGRGRRAAEGGRAAPASRLARVEQMQS